MYKFGTIVLVPFPFSDLSSAKIRPALIISKGLLGEDVVVSFITTNIHEKSIGVTILEGTKEFVDSGLKVSSRIRFDKIATLHKKILLGELGSVSPAFLKKEKENFQQIFGF